MQGKPIGERAKQLSESCAEDELVTAALRALPPQAASQVLWFGPLSCCCMQALHAHAEAAEAAGHTGSGETL